MQTDGTHTRKHTVSTDVGNTDRKSIAAIPRSHTDRTLDLDQVFEILKTERRRYVLQYLRATEKPVELGPLAEQIAAWENGKELQEITSSERKRVYVGLYQCHLPKMDGVEAVSFNKSRGIIEPGENRQIFYPYLDAPTRDNDGEWSKYYAGVSVLTIGAVLGAVVAESMLSIPTIATAVAVSLVAFATISLWYATSNM